MKLFKLKSHLAALIVLTLVAATNGYGQKTREEIP